MKLKKGKIYKYSNNKGFYRYTVYLGKGSSDSTYNGLVLDCTDKNEIGDIYNDFTRPDHTASGEVVEVIDRVEYLRGLLNATDPKS